MKMKLFNEDAEGSVIGAICIDGSCLLEVIDLVQPESFYVGKYRQIFEAAVELDKNGQEVELIALADLLDKKDRDPKSNWLPLLATLAKNTPSTKNIKIYAANVSEYQQLRSLYAVHSAGLDVCLDPDMTVGDKVAAAQEAILNLDQSGGSTGPKAPKDYLPEWVDHLERCRESGGGITGDSCGFPMIDERTKGFHAGELIVIAARPGMGKTNMALNIIAAYLRRQQTVLMFSLEMTTNELCGRMLPIMSTGLSYNKSLSAQFNEEEWTQVNNFIGTINQGKGLNIDDDASVSIADIRARSRKVKQRNGLDLIVVDYMGLVDAPGRSPTEVVENVSKGLKRLAKAMKCPVVALSQLSRKCDERPDKRPILSDLRQSGSIEQDADMVAFIYRDEVYNPDTQDYGIAEFIIGKLRHGQTGIVPLGTDFSRCLFTPTLRIPTKVEDAPKKSRGMQY